ncbi:glycosyltransferase family 87 protein [Frigoribacterium sp. PhB24]|uniref:glycosyltransferase family 87 protein n=1 Tax=Frigoribacterium sp. PhB24 TaxID=2485204 RepID=UPI0013156C51|nr:glycosyltransferase family 87 protein [Frigoribacterium sp. PhB24]
MTTSSAVAPAPLTARLGRRWARVQAHPRGLLYGFVAVHAAVFLALTPLMIGGGVSGDLPLYRLWATGALSDGVWPVLDFSWVYPAGAIVPIVLPDVFGEQHYQFVWLALLTALNAVALWLLTDRGRRTVDNRAAWWWLLVTLVLSPVAFLRLEGFSAPLVVAALMLLSTRPRVAGLLLAAATWIKVWPAAVIAAVVVGSRHRAVVVRAGVLVTMVVVSCVLLGRGADDITSFVTMQSGRALQLEATLATPWLWMAMLRVPGASVYQNVALATREVMGPGDTWMINDSTQVMLAVLVLLAGVLAVATFGLPLTGGFRRRGSAASDGTVTVAPARGHGDEFGTVLLGALTLTLAFVVFNKVGSPQYLLWIVPIVAVGYAARPEAFRTPAVLTAWASGLTTLVFPILYRLLVELNPVAVFVLGARNALLVVLFCWCTARLVRLAVAMVRDDALEVRVPVVATRAS